ncbi:MAG TPA: ABC transporter ATP-binding protein [Bacteroidota bacterium]|nr:ABC transporter ATP-binding protein [Bacteroidota bacterium]
MITFENIRKTYGKTIAVDGISLTITPHQVFGLLGPNGAGKTTLVNMAVGLAKPDSGSVNISGLGSPRNPTVRLNIGVAPQTLSLYNDLSAEENLECFGRIYGLRGAQLQERVAWSLDFVELRERKNDRVKKFSGGMKRRLNLAVALVHNPEFLILDEPTVGVDTQSRNAIFENIEQLKKEGCTVIYTTHYIEEAERLCDRVGIVDRGKLLALDSVDALIKQHGGNSTIVMEKADGEQTVETQNPIEDILRLQNEPGLLGFRVLRPSLETVFLSLTGRTLRD